MAVKVFPFADLSRSDLVVDAVYEGGTQGNAGDDPLSKILHCGNQGGFRKVGSRATRYVVLYSSLEDRNWPDYLDTVSGLFTYYGDNKKPGNELHDTTPGGNRLLAEVFQKIHSSPTARHEVPPFFIFTKASLPYGGRSVQFRGLAVPGAQGVPATDDLVAVWKSHRGQRFQNYKALFTILRSAHITRAWIEDVVAGNALSSNCPKEWHTWVGTGQYLPLVAQPAITFRSVAEQLPQTATEKAIVSCIYGYFKDDPSSFEPCAAAIASLLDPNIVIDQITRRSVDGGRDAIGRYRLGPLSDPVYVDFALEAKCYCPGLDGEPTNAVGVRETSRLISRLRFRQFGILVTTSVIGRQAYEEIRQDNHPVILLCGRDIATLLVDKGFNSVEAVHQWLQTQFPKT